MVRWSNLHGSEQWGLATGGAFLILSLMGYFSRHPEVAGLSATIAGFVLVLVGTSMQRSDPPEEIDTPDD